MNREPIQTPEDDAKPELPEKRAYEAPKIEAVRLSKEAAESLT
jgi:hypothetical protein